MWSAASYTKPPTSQAAKKKCVLVRWILNEPPLHLRQGPRGTAAGGLWAWDEREHVRLLTQSVLTEVTLLWDQPCRVAQLGAESFHQLVRWSLFVSSMLSCQKQTSNTAAKCLTAVCSSYSTTFGRQRHWRAKTKLSLHSLPTVSVSEQGCHSACRDCSVTCWLSVLVTALLFVFDTADILNCDHYFERGTRLKWGQAECSFYLPLCFPDCWLECSNGIVLFSCSFVC